MRDVLEGDRLPGYEGIHGVTTERNPWDFDDAASYLKYSLCQIELDRREAIAARYEKNKEIAKDSVPDLWQPLRELTEHLLPHLEFQEIDTSDKERVQCLWSVHEEETIVDIDDLSSGEKSIIQLFFPLVEHRVRETLRKVKEEDDGPLQRKFCALIDEPELHLHPNLQAKILDYFRTLSARDNAQFVVATHSPTIVENANSDELYLLRPAEMVSPDENQLKKVATDDEKLDLLREVFGSTSNLTAMRPLLIVEGKPAERRSQRAADERIYSFLSGQFSRVAILPAAGKAECLALTSSLNDILCEYSPELRAHALLDRDVRERQYSESTVHMLPVSMVENFLVDPAVIWKATALVRHKTELTNEDEVALALTRILDELEEAEIERRIKAAIGAKTFRLKDPISSVREQVSKFTRNLENELNDERVQSIRKECESRVEEIKEKNLRRELFRGKTIIDEYFKRHLHNTGMSKEMFIYECARMASTRKSVVVFVEQLMKAIGARVP